MGLAYKIFLDKDVKALIVDLYEEHYFLVNLPYQPKRAKSVIFKQVEEDFSREDLERYYVELRTLLGRESSIVFLTSADVSDYVHAAGDSYEMIATVGPRPPVCPGQEAEGKVATINLMVIVNEALSESGLLDLYKTVVEAKSLAAAELSLRCRTRSPGTVTDAVAVGRPAQMEGDQNFASMYTRLGSEVAASIYYGIISKGMEKLGIEGFYRNVLGVEIVDIIDLVMRIYSRYPAPGVDERKARQEAEKILRRFLEDPNVQSLVLAARELDLHASAGSVPGLTREEHKNDSVKIVADELIATALSLYMAGFKGLLSTYWVERLKEREGLFELPMFEDDVLSAIVGSTLSALYERLGVR